jgi:hypothetical protein
MNAQVSSNKSMRYSVYGANSFRGSLKSGAGCIAPGCNGAMRFVATGCFSTGSIRTPCPRANECGWQHNFAFLDLGRNAHIQIVCDFAREIKSEIRTHFVTSSTTRRTAMLLSCRLDVRSLDF